MVAPGQRRRSGEPGAAEEAVKQAEEIDQPLAEESKEERAKRWRTPGFQRMRFTWRPEDAGVVQSAHVAADQAIVRAFPDAYRLMNDIYTIVREPQMNKATGEVVTDANGFTVWMRTPDGGYVEDWSALTRKQMSEFIGAITVKIFGWEQTKDALWMDAMMAKAQFEERFAIAYDSSLKGTVDDRTAVGNKDAAEERYFAIFLSTLSRKADSLVRSMDRLSMRLNNLLTAG
jgi:hypothetical protein